jgi:sortase B
MAGKHYKEDKAEKRVTEDSAARESAHLSGEPKKQKPKKQKKHSVSRIISTILIVIGIALLAVAGGMWLKAQWQYHQQDEENAKLASYATVSDDGETAPVVDWEALKAINGDVVGWIQIPGTVVNYPVYQGDDNNHYLHYNAEGKYGVGGQIFMDYENTAPGMQDAQTIIYGHHLKNGAMFKQVADMADQDFFDSIDTVWYVTEDATYELEPLLVYYTNPEDTNVRVFSFADDEEFHSYLNDLLAKSQASRSDAAQIIGGTHHVLTLCTCNYEEGYGRTVLVCVPKDEAKAATSA